MQYKFWLFQEEKIEFRLAIEKIQGIIEKINFNAIFFLFLNKIKKNFNIIK